MDRRGRARTAPGPGGAIPGRIPRVAGPRPVPAEGLGRAPSFGLVAPRPPGEVATSLWHSSCNSGPTNMRAIRNTEACKNTISRSQCRDESR